jgi:tetratricopeptide (TPR) repeat protein
VGNFEQGLGIGKQALSLAIDLKEFALQIAANFFLGQLYHGRGDFRQAVDCTKWIINRLDGELSRKPLGMRVPPAILARTWLVWSLAEVGAFPEGIGRAEEGLKIAEGIDHLYSLFHAYWGIGLPLLRKGDFLGAITLLERSRSIAQIGHLPFMYNFTAANLGLAYAFAGRLEEAIEILEQTAKQTASLGMMFCNAISMNHLGEACLLANRIVEAMEIGGRALQICRDLKARGYFAWTFRLLGDIASHPQAFDSEKAEGYYGQAISLAEELGMRPLIAHCHLGFGRLYYQTGKQEEALEHLKAATAMFREMEMGFWIEKAETEVRKISTVGLS